MWLPEWRVGIEYQGAQHDGPVDYFGEEAFAATVTRDVLKRAACDAAGIVLIEARSGYDPAVVLDLVRAASRRYGP